MRPPSSRAAGSREVRELLLPLLALLLAGAISLVLESNPGRRVLHASRDISTSDLATVNRDVAERPVSLLRREVQGALHEASADFRDHLRAVFEEFREAIRPPRGEFRELAPMLVVPIRISGGHAGRVDGRAGSADGHALCAPEIPALGAEGDCA